MQTLERNLSAIRQARALVAALDDEAYVADGDESSIGAHLRHCLDMYGCFLRGVPSSHVDYDHRERSLSVERERSEALRAISDIEKELEQVRGLEPATRLSVRLEAAGSDLPEWAESTVLRELQFLLSHTIHHFAFIARLAHGSGVNPPPEFGWSSSTLANAKLAQHPRSRGHQRHAEP